MREAERVIGAFHKCGIETTTREKVIHFDVYRIE